MSEPNTPVADLDATATTITRTALAMVVDPMLAASARGDSALADLGIVDADMVCIAEAVRRAAGRSGFEIVVGDQDLGAVRSCADLTAVVRASIDARRSSSRTPKEGHEI